MASQTSFEPNQHLTHIKGQEYLEVKWRIAWLRAEHPAASIDTELIAHENGQAIFRATIRIPDGGSATAFGSETANVFPNYIEKAETKAVGRALAALGFGTQFCGDFEEAPEASGPETAIRAIPTPAGPSSGEMMTGPQRQKIAGMAVRLQLSRPQLDAAIRQTVGSSLESLTKRQASRVIDALTQRLETPTQQQAS